MTEVKTFADTSTVSLAYGLSNAADPSSMTLDTLQYIPFTQEGFTMSKSSQQSTAIRGNRRNKGSKNTAGTTAGSAGLEFGFTPFIHDMLALAAMSEWRTINEQGDQILLDSDVNRFMYVEKRIKADRNGARHNDIRRFFGHMVNEATIEVGNENLVAFTVNTMGVFADFLTREIEVDENGAVVDEDVGGMATTYLAPPDYEIADASNNLKNAVLKNAQGEDLEVTFSDFSFSVSNNVREQRATGSEFAAGMGKGKVAPQVSGTVYYYDSTVLEAHMGNDYLAFQCDVATAEGTYTIILPAGKAEAPDDNASGENQDYTQSLTINGEEGQVEVDGETYTCAFAIIKRAV